VLGPFNQYNNSCCLEAGCPSSPRRFKYCILSKIPRFTLKLTHLLSDNEGVQFDGDHGTLATPMSHEGLRVESEPRLSAISTGAPFAVAAGFRMDARRANDRRRRGREQQQRRVLRRRLTLLLVAACSLVLHGALTGDGDGGIPVVLGFVGPRGVSGFRSTLDRSSRSCIQDAHRRHSSMALKTLLEEMSVGCKGPKLRSEPPERVLIHWRYV
jgi:hypothetical protein